MAGNEFCEKLLTLSNRSVDVGFCSANYFCCGSLSEFRQKNTGNAVRANPVNGGYSIAYKAGIFLYLILYLVSVFINFSFKPYHNTKFTKRAYSRFFVNLLFATWANNISSILYFIHLLLSSAKFKNLQLFAIHFLVRSSLIFPYRVSSCFLSTDPSNFKT